MLQNPLKGVVDDAPAVVQSRMYQNGRGVPQDDAEVSFLKISSAAEIVAFQRTAGYRLQHANDHHERRRVEHFGVTAHPTADWVAQQVREAFPWATAPQYLIRDRP